MQLSDAVIQRYTTNDSDHLRNELYVLTASEGRKSIEFVGEEKAQRKFSKLDELTAVEVRNVPIAGCGAISSICPRLVQVDLTDTQQSSWDVVLELCRQLPQLQNLNLQHNPRLPRPLPLALLDAGRALRLLSLCNTGLGGRRSLSTPLEKSVQG